MREYRDFTMKTIVLATDFSDASYGALNYAKQLARFFSAKILLVHAVAGAEAATAKLPKLMDAAEDELQKYVDALSHDGVRSAMIVRAGDIRTTVSHVIAEREADLLVIGTRGKGYKNGEGLGSVAESLLRAVPCPVLTVGRNVRQDAWENTHPRSVLFPTDFSEVSRAALAYTEHLVKHLGGRLLLLHVDEKKAAEHKEEFQALMKEMRDASVVSESITRAGRPADAAVAISNEKHVDFIVMGVHGTDRAGKEPNYGMAFDIVRQAKCPVFTLFTASKKEMAKAEQKDLTEAERFRLQQQRLAIHHSQ